MTAVRGEEARDLLDLIEGRERTTCPVCRAAHCLTSEGRLWIHGPRGARCRGSRLRPKAARLAAATVRGVRTTTEAP